MKIKLLLLSSLCMITLTNAYADDVSQTLLPSPFPVYINKSVIINHPAPGFLQKQLPTNNDYKGKPGCYVICYSHQSSNAIYQVSDTIYVMGQIRVAGEYMGRVCVPSQFSGKDISAEQSFKDLCSQKIQSCSNNNCWVGGDSGGWFGIQ